MNQKSINRLFTEKALELLGQGFQINTGSMGGSQGEYAHVDFRKGDEVRRLLLAGYDKDLIPNADEAGKEYVVLQVGRAMKPIGRSWGCSLWNGQLEIIFEIIIEVTCEP